jgi:hypothetical protein
MDTVIDADHQWWGFNATHGWVVVDWNDPRNSPGQQAVRRLYIVRCSDWQEVSIHWSEWSTFGYVSAKEKLVSCGNPSEQSQAGAALEKAQTRFHEDHLRIESVRAQMQGFIPFVMGKQFLELCDSQKLDAFYHITHTDNLPGILTEGLLCHRQARPARDISNPEIQQHRADKPIPGAHGRTLHDCVPLFFAPRPPMLSALRDEQAAIIYVLVKCCVLLLPGVVCTDGNARSNTTTFLSRLDDLRRLDWGLLRAKYWNHQDPEQHRENKRRRSAEVLVPHCIPRVYIERIVVMTEQARKEAAAILHNAQSDIPVISDPELYYPAPPKSASEMNVAFGGAGNEIPF